MSSPMDPQMFKQLQADNKTLGTRAAALEAAQKQAAAADDEIAGLTDELKKALARGDSTKSAALAAKVQAAIAKRQKMFDMLSNLMKMMDDQAKAIAQNLRG